MANCSLAPSPSFHVRACALHSRCIPTRKTISSRCVLCVRLVFLAQPDRHCSHKTMAEVKCHLVTRYGTRQRIDVPRAPRDQKSQSVETWPLARGQKSPDAQKGCSVIAL